MSATQSWGIDPDGTNRQSIPYLCQFHLQRPEGVAKHKTTERENKGVG